MTTQAEARDGILAIEYILGCYLEKYGDVTTPKQRTWLEQTRKSVRKLWPEGKWVNSAVPETALHETPRVRRPTPCH